MKSGGRGCLQLGEPQHARPRSAGKAGRAEARLRPAGGEGVGSPRQAARCSSDGVLRGAGGGGWAAVAAKGEAACLNLGGLVRLPGLGAGLRLGKG